MKAARVALFALGSVLVAAPAFADITAFIGANTTPANRLTTGVAIGASLLVIGFEGEYANTSEDASANAPGLQTGMGSIYLQNPIPIAGIQVYAITGAGLYNESLAGNSTFGAALNVGGGAKIELVSHVRLRIDYRVLSLTGSPHTDRVQRVYAGLNLAF